MIGLPHAYRFRIFNSSGIAIAAAGAKVYARRRKLSGTDGQLSYEATEATVYSNAGSVATATYDQGATISNDTDKYLSGDFIFEVTLTGSPAGDVFLYLERATDGGTIHWPDAGKAAIVAKLSFSAAATSRIDFSL